MNVTLVYKENELLDLVKVRTHNRTFIARETEPPEPTLWGVFADLEAAKKATALYEETYQTQRKWIYEGREVRT